MFLTREGRSVSLGSWTAVVGPVRLPLPYLIDHAAHALGNPLS